jgi:lipoprotein-anchoring transpeptidase ErfK/SrfK
MIRALFHTGQVTEPPACHDFLVTRRAIAQLAVILFIAAATHPALAAQPRKKRPSKPAALRCGDLVGFQVLLDRQGFSPGQIDGLSGTSFSHALSALQSARGLPVTGRPDCATWQALSSAGSDPTISTYTVTGEDVKGPFVRIPPKIAQQASLTSLAYQSLEEELAERFHASPALLQRLNPGGLREGREIRVPAVSPFNAAVKPPADPAAANATVLVSREDSALRVQSADGKVIFYAPVTTGSEHDPLPTGDYKVLGESWLPNFHYNPELFWDAKESDEKATIKPGPNNPVGVVWIALSLEHYGLHGTPEPGRIGHTESHGCVRLTNWDAARVTALVKPGTVVQFR